MANEDYLNMCIAKQIVKEDGLKEVTENDDVELSDEEKRRFRKYLLLQALKAKSAFARKEVVPGSLSYNLAVGVHDGWTVSKYKDGWKFGETRNDDEKVHNLMKPANQLTFSEFQWDVDTGISAILEMAFSLGE